MEEKELADAAVYERGLVVYEKRETMLSGG